MKKNKIQKIDREHIWHPYDSITNKTKTYEVKKAYKSTIELFDGRKLIDGMSSWWSCIHGYNNKYINKALNKQINKFSHIMFGGLTHKPAAKLATNLKKILDKDFDTFFYCDSGSVAVEIAIKMVFQYHMGMGNYKKNKILSFERAYHGDTFMAMSLCDPINSMHSKFSNILPHNISSTAPKSRFNAKYEDDHIYTEKIVEENIDELAAIIIEPIVQGAGGMYFYNSEFLNNLKRICDKHGLLLIFDEIATGFGRTGKMFAYNYSNIKPDIICLGKAITGGYLSFATVCTNKNIARVICDNKKGIGNFMHGPTFMGNPLACTAANASIHLLSTYNLEKKIMNIENIINSHFLEAKNFDFVQDVRVLGAIGVIELKQPVNLNKITKMFISKGIWVRPFGKLIYIMPPFIITDKELKKLCNTVIEVIWKYHN